MPKAGAPARFYRGSTAGSTDRTLGDASSATKRLTRPIPQLAHTEGQADDTRISRLMAGACLGTLVFLSALRSNREPALPMGSPRTTRCWNGTRSSSTRSSRRIPRTLPVSGSGRSCTRRSSMPTTASRGATRQSWFIRASSPRRIAPSGGHRRRVHGAGRPVPIPAIGVGCQLCRVARGAERARWRWMSGRSLRARDRLGNGGRAGRAGLARERWFQHQLPGVRRVARRSASGGRWRRQPSMSAQGLAFTDMFVLASNSQFQPPPPRDSGQRHLRGRLQCRQGAWPQDRLDAHRGTDGARAFLGRQRECPLESGRQPDRARQSPLHVRRPTGFSRC